MRLTPSQCRDPDRLVREEDFSETVMALLGSMIGLIEGADQHRAGLAFLAPMAEIEELAATTRECRRAIITNGDYSMLTHVVEQFGTLFRGCLLVDDK